MRWPDAIELMAQKLKAQLESNGETIPVFLGAYAVVPNVDAIYIWRSRALPVPSGLCGGAAMQVMVEVWTKAERAAISTTELTTVNAQIAAAWRRQDSLVERIRTLTFADVGVYAVFKGAHQDNGEFYPMIGESIEFTVNYDNEG